MISKRLAIFLRLKENTVGGQYVKCQTRHCVDQCYRFHYFRPPLFQWLAFSQLRTGKPESETYCLGEQRYPRQSEPLRKSSRSRSPGKTVLVAL